MANRLLLLALLFYLSPVSALVLHVPADISEVESAMRLADYGDTVLVASGIYYEHSVPLFSGVTLLAEDMEQGATVIHAEDHTFVIVAEYVDASAVLRGFTLRGAAGSALFLDQSHPLIADCLFTQNDGYDGGGALIWGSESRFERCRFSGNIAYRGGAVHMIEGDSEPSFIDCEFYWNTSREEGGALWAEGARPYFEDCVFYGNESFIDGGALFLRECPYGEPVFAGCVFAGNHAPGLGGVGYLDFNSPLFEGCTFVDNAAGGGALFHLDIAFPQVERSILAFNGPGDLMDCHTLGEPRMSCCDLYGNEGGDEVCGLDLGGNFSAYPYFCDLDGDDWSLAASSPCLPLGNSCGVLIGARGLGCEDPVDAPEAAPAGTLRLTAFPNPFNPSTEIQVRVDKRSKFELEIYDIAGRRIRRLHTVSTLGKGLHEFAWDGVDQEGRPVSSGAYLLSLQQDGRRETLRLILIK